jgi:2,4-dienoyl-CoA reductase-like NADH-dependent reductase (Old Yellow Enzyme family)
VLSPSQRFDGEGNKTARALSKGEIARIVDDFGAAAGRAQEVGFDAVQLHFAHGYLGSQFLSPRHNQRKDGYGGSLENRFRFLKEVYLAARAALGDGYPLMAKLNLEDFLEDGLVFEDGLKAAQRLKDLGLDALEVSGGTAESGRLGPARRVKKAEDEAYFLQNARAVKENIGLPVVLVGGLRDPGQMETIHRETGIDYFSMSRPFIREPHLIRRWEAGDLQPAACVSCSGCFLSIKLGRGICCVKTLKRKRN